MNAAHRKKNARPGEPGQASFGKRMDTDTPDTGMQECGERERSGAR